MVGDKIRRILGVLSLSLSVPPSRTDGPVSRCLPMGVRQSVCTCACACGHRGQVGFSEGNVVVVVGSTGLRAATTSLTCRWRRPTPAPGGIPGTTYGSDRARCEPRRQQVASSLAACNPRPTHPRRATRDHTAPGPQHGNCGPTDEYAGQTRSRMRTSGEARCRHILRQIGCVQERDTAIEACTLPGVGGWEGHG